MGEGVFAGGQDDTICGNNRNALRAGEKMKKSLHLDLLEFHVREAAQELDLLLDAIQYGKDGTRRKGAVGDEPLHWPLREGALAASLEHAYHHLNFAWNGRFKTMQEADAQFDRNEKFPRPREKCGRFAKFWPRSKI